MRPSRSSSASRRLTAGDQRLALAGRHGGELALVGLLEGGAVAVGGVEVALELGAVDAGIEVVEVPFRQRAELGAGLDAGLADFFDACLAMRDRLRGTWLFLGLPQGLPA